MAVMIASPAAMPSEPPMKAKSWTAITTGMPSIEPVRGDDRVLGAGLLPRLLEPVAVAALVAEAQGIERRPDGSSIIS